MSLRDWMGVVVLLLIALAVTDCSVGQTRYCAGIVRQHMYHPPYKTTDCHTVNGHTSCSDTHHPAEYHLLVYVPSPEHAADVETKLINYLRYADGAHVVVGERCGRWSGIIWLDWIEPDKTPDY